MLTVNMTASNMLLDMENIFLYMLLLYIHLYVCARVHYAYTDSSDLPPR